MSDETPNSAQIEYWNGPTAEVWAREQARLDRAFAPLTAALVARIGARLGEQILDVGCGCGELSLILSGQVGRAGRVVGLDVSEPMLSVARQRAEALHERDPQAGPIIWRRADAAAERLEPTFDALVSRFGVMFFDDPVAAFRSLRAALKPGGRLAMLCWQEAPLNGWATVPMGAVAARYGAPDPTPPGAPGPFAFADRDRVLGILGEAGFTEVAADPVSASSRLGTATAEASALDDAVGYAMSIGPVSRYLRERPDIRAGATEAVREALAPYVRGDAVEVPSACWIYSGRNT